MVSIGWSLDQGDYGSALQTGAGATGALLGRANPLIGLTTFLGQQLIGSQQNSAQEGIDAMEATGASYSQTMDQINSANGENNVKQWLNEFNSKGCNDLLKKN